MLLTDALHDLADESVAASAILELEATNARNTLVMSAVRRHREYGSRMLARALDCAGELDGIVRSLDERSREALLSHPFWRLRALAVWAGPSAQRERDGYAVMATIVAAGFESELDEQKRNWLVDRRWAAGADDWRRLSQRADLPPLPPAVDGLTSRCAEYRRWAIGYVMTQHRTQDAPALVFADELDRALASRGHPRTIIDWTSWPEIPAQRLAWARERMAVLPAALRDAVANDMPPGKFWLETAEREALLREEAAVTDR